MNFTRQEILNYMTVKKTILKLMFVGAESLVDDNEAERIKIQRSILSELMTGVEESQLGSKEIDAIPHEYIR